MLDPRLAQKGCQVAADLKPLLLCGRCQLVAKMDKEVTIRDPDQTGTLGSATLALNFCAAIWKTLFDSLWGMNQVIRLLLPVCMLLRYSVTRVYTSAMYAYSLENLAQNIWLSSKSRRWDVQPQKDGRDHHTFGTSPI